MQTFHSSGSTRLGKRGYATTHHHDFDFSVSSTARAVPLVLASTVWHAEAHAVLWTSLEEGMAA